MFTVFDPEVLSLRIYSEKKKNQKKKKINWEEWNSLKNWEIDILIIIYIIQGLWYQKLIGTQTPLKL